MERKERVHGSQRTAGDIQIMRRGLCGDIHTRLHELKKLNLLSLQLAEHHNIAHDLNQNQ